jgi:hypothetical protein
MTYNVWNKWGKLKTVMLGTCHPPEFFDYIKEPKIKDPLSRILEETQEDLDNFAHVLKQFGCTVLRPQTEYQDSYENLNGSIPKSSLQPRDYQLVMGNKFVVSSVVRVLNNKGITNCAKEYNSKDMLIDPHAITSSISQELTEHEKGWVAACLTVVGDRVYYDALEVAPKHLEWLKNKFPQFKYIKVEIGGHNDGTFHTLKPGAILSLYDIQTYEKTFPNWDVCYLPDQSWEKVKPFNDMKNATQGKWWVPGEETNYALIEFVNTWLDKWVGYVEETVFDVNVLVLDEHHVCVSNINNQQVNNFLKKHNMEPVHIPWRHRYFWDGGLHCITLDLEREGNMENYF